MFLELCLLSALWSATVSARADLQSPEKANRQISRSWSHSGDDGTVMMMQEL